jgi:hypothetical protein
MNLHDIRSRLRLRCVGIGLSKIGMTARRLCKSLKIDSHQVMDTFIQDEKLNLSLYYLKFGLAFCGFCLPIAMCLLSPMPRLVIDLAQLYANFPSDRHYQGLS